MSARAGETYTGPTPDAKGRLRSPDGRVAIALCYAATPLFIVALLVITVWDRLRDRLTGEAERRRERTRELLRHWPTG